MDRTMCEIAKKYFGLDYSAKEEMSSYSIRRYVRYELVNVVANGTTWYDATSPMYVEFRHPKPRKGSIARIIAICPDKYSCTFMAAWDDKPGKTAKVDLFDFNILDNYTGPTKWVWQAALPTEKPEIPPHENKFGQELLKGTYVIAMAGRSARNSTLQFGIITRWTETSVFMNPITQFKGDNKTNKKNEVPISLVKQTFIIPDECVESIEASLSVAKLTV
jgi:hypothetical protein